MQTLAILDRKEEGCLVFVTQQEKVYVAPDALFPQAQEGMQYRIQIQNDLVCAVELCDNREVNALQHSLSNRLHAIFRRSNHTAPENRRNSSDGIEHTS